VRLVQPRHPDRPDALHPRIIEDLIEIAEGGHQEALNAMVLMLEDLAQFGTASRFAGHLQGMPIWELKTRSRGGLKGGARVYWFPLTLRFKTLEPETVAVMVNAEIKPGDTPNPRNLEEALEVYFAFQDDPVGMLRRSS
jgi:hypothetical protein